jgi:hypothetical protein
MIIQNRKLSIIRRFDHEFLLWRNFMQTYIDQSFDLNLCYLIETKCDSCIDVLIIHLSENFMIY